MLNKKISELLNRQLNAELHSAYLYLAFESYFDHISLDGFANWYRVQLQEETDHAMIIYRYLNDQGENIRFDAVREVSADGMGILDVLREAKNHESEVSEMIGNLYSAASETNDLRTMSFLEWFIREQSEEEKNADTMIQKYLMYGLLHLVGSRLRPLRRRAVRPQPGVCRPDLYRDRISIQLIIYINGRRKQRPFFVNVIG